MNAEARTNDLLRKNPKMRADLLEKAHKGEIPDLDRFGLKPEDLVVLAEGKRAAPTGLEAAGGQEPVRLRALEAIVRRFGRPVLLIQNDTYVAPDSDSVAAELAPHRARIEKAIKSVGRVEFINHSMPWGGTGWLVDKNIMLTNRHVAELVGESNGAGGFRFRVSVAGVPYGARLDFKEEYTVGGIGLAKEVPVKSIKYIARTDQPDIALFQVDVDGTLPPPIELLSTASVQDQAVGVIGYPAYDSRNDPDDVVRYFGDIFDVKRFAPGVVSQVGGGQTFFMHDSTTLGGNSGSVVLDLATGRALGLHFAGTYLVGNYAVTAEQIKRALSGLKATVSVPANLASINEAPDGVHQPSFFKGRKGYVSGFLGSGALKVPLLGLGGHAHDATNVDNNGGKFLDYTHFSLAFSTSRRVPIFTAVNIDGSKTKKIKRANDKWFKDLRLPANIQLTSEDYGHPDIDRGHMVRREDPNWGTMPVAKLANDDTFHYTNAAPQHARLNQGKTQWLGLEEYVLSNAKTHGLSISVFTGPVLRDGDPSLPNGVQVPGEFWKVVVFLNPKRELRASGYVLSQGKLIEDITESFVFGEYRTYQVPIAKIAKATGLEFNGLEDVDVLKKTPLPESVPGMPTVIALNRLEDMVL
jgi:endonuclease G, mitochondrial